jgi:hypothetical protein
MNLSGMSLMAQGAMIALRDFETLHFVPTSIAKELCAAGLAELDGDELAITPKGRDWRPVFGPEGFSMAGRSENKLGAQ